MTRAGTASKVNAAVCIINYNTCDLLRSCLHSVWRDSPSEIVVFDNASTDGSAEMVETEFPNVKLLRNSKNIGYGAAANLAVRDCSAEQIVLLNSDTVLQPGSIRAMCAYMEAHPTAGIVGPKIVQFDGSPQTSCYYFPTPLHLFLFLSGFYRFVRFIPFFNKRSLQVFTTRPASAVPWVLGAAMTMRREAFEAVRGFDEDFFLYFEETDLSYRMAQKGWHTHFSPAAEVMHLGGASAAQQPAKTTLQYFASLALFYRKHYSPLRYLVMTFMVESAALAWLVRDAFRFRFVDQERRAALLIYIRAWQRLLSGRWSGFILE